MAKMILIILAGIGAVACFVRAFWLSVLITESRRFPWQ